LEFKNRAREILDLFASDTAPNGGQFAQLVEEFRRILCPENQPRTWPELDMALWNYHPRSNTPGEFYLNPYTKGWSGEAFRRELPTPDFPGFCRYIINFCSDSRPRKNYQPDDNNPLGYGWGVLAWEAQDDKIPDRPRVSQTLNSQLSTLNFSISPYASPKNQSPFAAVQWRLAQIKAPGLAGYEPGRPFAYELTPSWQSEPLPAAEPIFRLPPSACKPGHTCRVRARYKDASGRWSHWSEPVQFVSGGDKP
jgi:hypothetical protein